MTDTAHTPTGDLRVDNSAVHGRGVFAGRRFVEGELVEACPVLVFPADEVEYLEQTALRGYYYEWDEEGGVGLALGLGSLYNHSATPNARTEVDCDEGFVRYFARRDIEAGEEITIDYTGGHGDASDLWFDPAETGDG